MTRHAVSLFYIFPCPSLPANEFKQFLITKPPDRVPIILGASNATGISMPAYKSLADLLGIKVQEKYLYDWPELGTAAMDKSILEELRSDVRGVHDREHGSHPVRGTKSVNLALLTTTRGVLVPFKATQACGFPQSIHSPITFH